MIRPTILTLILIGAAVPIAIVAVVVDPALWVLPVGYLVGFAVLLAAETQLGLRPAALKMEIDAPAALHMAGQGRLRIKLAAPQAAAGTKLDLVVDADDRLEEPAPVSLVLDANGDGECEIPLFPKRRGDIRLDRLWLRWTGPFALQWRVLERPLERRIAAIPNLPAVKRAAIQLARRAVIHGVKPQLMQGDGVEFDALREHVAGMDYRAVDWKHSARHRKIVCKEFRSERNHNIIIAFDHGQLMGEPIDGVPKLDHAINAGLVMAYQALSEGDRVAVYGFAARPGGVRFPISGPAAFRQLLAQTNDLEYSAEETNYTLGLGTLMGALRRRSIIILLTDILDTVSAELMVRNLERLARDHLVIFVALREPAALADLTRAPGDAEDLGRIVVAMDLEDERAAVLSRLRRVGVDPINVAPGDLNVALLNAYLKVKQLAMVDRI